MKIIEKNVKNDIFNISGNYEDTNLSVVKKILHLYNKIENYQDYVHNLQRPGQDVRYSISDTKLKNLGWKPMANFNTELAKIVEYYKNNFVW